MIIHYEAHREKDAILIKVFQSPVNYEKYESTHDYVYEGIKHKVIE